MAVLTGELGSGSGMPLISAASLQAFSTISTGSVLDSLLVSYGLINASAGFFLQTSLSAIALLFANQGNYQIYQSSFVRFFGEGFKQDSSKIYIQKNSLPLLTLSNNNTAESLLVALLLQIKQYESNSLISLATVEIFSQNFISSNNDSHLILTTLLLKLYVRVTYVSAPNPELGNQIINSSPINPNQF